MCSEELHLDFLLQGHVLLELSEFFKGTQTFDAFLQSSLKIITVKCFQNQKASLQELSWPCLDG